MPRYAAIDIGSNSIRMQAADVAASGSVEILVSAREVTRLGESVFSSGRISEDAIALVCQVLQRMSASYQQLGVVAVRAVATSAVRDASNQAEFIARASAALGTPVEIISGLEEARLIYLGVQAQWPTQSETVLIIDVGGGSAEFIVSEKGVLRQGLSRPLGAVRLKEVFLESDPPTQAELHRLENFIDEKFEPVLKQLSSLTIDRVIGTSATAAAIVSAIHQIARTEREAADKLSVRTSQVQELFEQLRRKNLPARRKVIGIGPRRAEIIVAGVAVFARTLELLKLKSMHYSTAGVRDGIIADLAARRVGRERSRLSEQQLQVVDSMCRKYGAGVRQANHISDLGIQLFDSLAPLHKLPAEQGRLIQAAAYLHNCGHFISDTGHHKHSAYIATNSDLPGFTDQERTLVALLCRYHRKSMPTVRHEGFRSLKVEDKKTILLLAPLLRIAIALDLSGQQRVKSIRCQADNEKVAMIVEGEGDIDLEIWAAEQAAELFAGASGIPVQVERQPKL